MDFSDLTSRIAGESVDTWSVHYRGMERLNAGEDIYLMSVGQESDSFSPEVVVRAAVDSLQRGRHHYTAVEGDPELRQAIAQRYEANGGRRVDPDDVVVFAGAQNALFATAQVLLQAGDEVILIEPYYTTYPATFTASGATQVNVVLDADRGFMLDATQVAAAITPRTRAIVVNSPNNPTGAIYSKDSLRALVDTCRAHGIWLISDDVYLDIIHTEAARAFDLPGAEEVVISVSSVSKSHRMTGWRIGWAVGPSPLATHFYNLNMCMSYGLPAFTQDAALWALRSKTGISAEVATRLESRRQVLLDELKRIPKIEVIEGGGGMFVMVSVRPLGMDSMTFAGNLLDEEGVSVQPCTGFGASCAGLIRISAVLEEPRLREACRRIARYVDRL